MAWAAENTQSSKGSCYVLSTLEARAEEGTLRTLTSGDKGFSTTGCLFGPFIGNKRKANCDAVSGSRRSTFLSQSITDPLCEDVMTE